MALKLVAETKGVTDGFIIEAEVLEVIYMGDMLRTRMRVWHLAQMFDFYRRFVPSRKPEIEQSTRRGFQPCSARKPSPIPSSVPGVKLDTTMSDLAAMLLPGHSQAR